MDITDNQYKDAIFLEMQEEKKLNIALSEAYKDIERKSNIIMILMTLIMGTNDQELIIKMNTELRKDI